MQKTSESTSSMLLLLKQFIREPQEQGINLTIKQQEDSTKLQGQPLPVVSHINIGRWVLQHYNNPVEIFTYHFCCISCNMEGIVTIIILMNFSQISILVQTNFNDRCHKM